MNVIMETNLKVNKIQINKYYRHKATPNYGWAKAIEILKPRQKENHTTYTIVKCEWSVGWNDLFGVIKYFRASDLIDRKQINITDE